MKYPRTPYLPWLDVSGPKADLNHFVDKQLIFTEKLDGENIMMSRDDFHARSETSGFNPEWRDYVKGLWSSIQYQIPALRRCGACR